MLVTLLCAHVRGAANQTWFMAQTLPLVVRRRRVTHDEPAQPRPETRIIDDVPAPAVTTVHRPVPMVVDAPVPPATSTLVPGNMLYSMVTDLASLQEEEAAEERNLVSFGETVKQTMASIDLFTRIEAGEHTEKSWQLALAVMKKVRENIVRITEQSSKLAAFDQQRMRNIERLTQRAAAVAAGADVNVAPGTDDRNEQYVFRFANETLGSYEVHEQLNLSVFETR